MEERTVQTFGRRALTRLGFYGRDRRDVPVARRSPIYRFGIAIICIVLAAALAISLRPVETAPVSFMSFLAAVMIASWYGGLGPGLFVTFVGMMIAAIIIDHHEGLATTWVRLLLYTVLGCAMTWIIHSLQRSWRLSELSRISAKRLEEVARQSEERYRLLVDNVKDHSIILLNPEGTIITWNSGAEELHGYTTSEILGKHFSRLFPQEIANTLPQQLLDRCRQEGRAEDEGWRLNKDGSRMWASTVITALYDNHRNLIGFTKITRDLTRRRRSQELFMGVLESAPDAMVICDQHGRIMLVNAQAEKLFGYSRNELIGQAVEFLIAPDQREEHARVRNEYMAHPVVRDSGQHLDIKARRRDGSFVPVEISLSPVYTAEGVLIASSVRDTTERRRIAEELKRAKEQAEAANRAKDQFLAMLSHELRTPLTPALLTTSSIESAPNIPPEIRQDAEVVRQNIELEARLIDDLLDVTRISRGKLVMNFENVDVNTQLRAAVQLLDKDIHGKDQHLTMELPCERCLVRGDPARLQQVFWNLLKNAIKFTPRQGSIWIRSNLKIEQPRSVAVEISDSGIGIPPESLPKLFSLFEQTDTNITRQFGGLGLGLAISKSLIDMHRGRISAFSRGRNMGSTFIVELPLLQQAVAEAPAPESPARGKSAHNSRILLVEDHPDTLRALAHLLKSVGYYVATAQSASQAIEIAAREQLDILISDIGLPDGSGNDLMRRLKQERHLRGIALTGYGSEEDLAANREAGFQAQLTKPISLHQLEDVIERVSRMPAE